MPRSETTPPITLLVTVRVTSRAITCVVDSLAARRIGAEDGADHRAKLAENPALRGLGCRSRAGNTLLKHFIGGFRVDRGVVFSLDRARRHDGFPLVRGDRPDPGGRRANHHTLDHGRRAIALQERHQRLAFPKFSDDLGRIKRGIGPERVGSCLNGLLIAWREGTQGVLNTVAKLGKNLVGHVDRILRDEIHADTFGTDQADHLLDLVHQRLRRIIEQQMRFIKEEHELRQRYVADFGSSSNNSDSIHSRNVA